MVNTNAQIWLDEKYPIDGVCKRDNDPENKNKSRSGITALDIRKGKVGNGIFNQNKNLVDNLKLQGFANLRKLIVSSHELIGLDVSKCPNLEELDCHGNELTNLKVSGCSNLKKIDCSNNPLQELDLSACSKLEEVNIAGCPAELTEINSPLIFDAETNKLILGTTKSSPQVTKARADSIRNILIIGITGNGKSALANTLSNSNQFTEKNSSTSVTKNFQSSNVFTWVGKKYRLIDNVGFGDTNNLSNDDILYEIGKGIHSVQEGINQILFVFGGRFGPEQVIAYNLFKDFINESGIDRFTTLVRTRFVNFRNLEKCQDDKDKLLTQNLELKEIINSCNGIIHVDNPSVVIEKDSEDSEEEKEEKKKKVNRNEEKRKLSRERLLNHLAENCLEIYKLKAWDGIVAKVNEYNNQKTRIEQSDSLTKKEELEKAKSETNKEIKLRLEADPLAYKAAIELGYSWNKKIK